MERWEYQVIHLNVEAPAPAPAPPPAAEPAADAAPTRVEAVFSKEYLEKEFPGFYGANPPAGAPSREHPANQLRGFLNLQGKEGWQLIGFYPVGQLTMMIFRRPLVTADAPADPVAASPATDAASPAAGSGPAAAAGSPEAGSSGEQAAEPAAAATGRAPQDQGAALERILERLEALERRLTPRAPQPSQLPPPALAAAVMPQWESDALADLQDGEILPEQHWGALDGQPRLSTPEAARALGFRSAASLLNLAARSGYRQGLVKRGAKATLAVYLGSERSGRGGRDRRLWVVLQAAG